jgi:hypothetical protein
VRAGGSSRLRLALVKGVLVRRLAVNLTRGVGMLSLELVERDGGEDGRLVDDRGLVDLLVDGDDGVDGLVGVGLLLDNGLDVLVTEHERDRESRGNSNGKLLHFK